MVWTAKNYPDSMKALSPVVRNKAIEMANALIYEDFPQSRAIPLAITSAKEWARRQGHKV